MKKIFILLKLIVGFVGVQGQFCTKHFVGGKWISHGHCGAPSNIDQEIRGKHKLDTGNYLTSCTGVRFEHIPRNVRKTDGGLVELYIPNVGFRNVYCDLTTDGGNWIVFQKRNPTSSGLVNFDRGWNQYVKGFGSPLKEFWLGLEALRQMTMHGDHELRIDMTEKDNGRKYYVKYRTFQVGPGSDGYRLRLSGYSGNIGDQLANVYNRTHPYNQPFRTSDLPYPDGGCAQSYASGWWYGEGRNCGRSFLNSARPTWYDDSRQRYQSMRLTEMKFRRAGSGINGL